MAAGCSPEKKKRIDKLLEIHDMWFDKEGDVGRNIHAVTGQDTKYWKKFYEGEMQTDFDYGVLPKLKDLKRLERKVKKFSRQMGKKPGSFAKWFYLPENVMSKNPVTKSYFDNVVVAGNYYRGNMHKVTSNLDRIVELVNMSTKENTLMGRLGLTRSKAQKKMAEDQAEFQKLNKTDPDAAITFHNDNIKNLSKDSEIATMQNLHKLMIDPNSILKGNRVENASKYGTNLVQAADLWHNKMAPELWKVLNTGINDYIKVLESNQTALGIEQKTIDNIKENLLVKNKKGQWEMAKQDNYFPTQVLDIIPTFNTLTESIWSGEYGNKVKDMDQYINKMTKDISNNLKLDGNVFERGNEAPTNISKNVLSIIDTYAKGATRFNYTARVTKDTVKALQDLHKMEGKDMDDHIQFLGDYIRDTHASAVGMDMKQSKFGKIARAITSWQFMSKLGFNIRGAARNATQSLQNYIYFGYKGIREYNRFATSDTMKDLMTQEMKRHGVFFTNLEELAMPAEFLPSTKMVDGKLVEVAPGTAENFTHYLERVAKFSGKPMQWVENNINRSLTFKIAFSKMYNELTQRKDILQKNLETTRLKEGVKIEDAVNAEITRRSSRFAANMVKELHYEYSPFAKPKVLRTAPGSILGQFSTYSINFFEYNRKILSEGIEGAMHGEWGENGWRMTRLGLTYAAIDAMISPLFSTDIGKLVQHDTKDRLEQLYTWFTGDEAERKKVFFGKGPAIGTFGGPFISDLITVGQLTNFMKMKENDWMSYMAGYQDFAERTKDDKVFEYVRLLNTQLARTMYGTIPKMVNGTGLTTLVGSELGLYGSSNIKRQHNKLFSDARKVTPGFMDDYLTPLSEKQRLAKGYKRALQGKPNKNLNPDDLRAIMSALEKMKG